MATAAGPFLPHVEIYVMSMGPLTYMSMDVYVYGSAADRRGRPTPVWGRVSAAAADGGKKVFQALR